MCLLAVPAAPFLLLLLLLLLLILFNNELMPVLLLLLLFLLVFFVLVRFSIFNHSKFFKIFSSEFFDYVIDGIGLTKNWQPGFYQLSSSSSPLPPPPHKGGRSGAINSFVSTRIRNFFFSVFLFSLHHLSLSLYDWLIDWLINFFLFSQDDSDLILSSSSSSS